MCETIYNPPVQIFTQNRQVSLQAAKAKSPSVELSFPEPYTAMTRERGSSEEGQMLIVEEQKIREGRMRVVMSMYR